MRGIGWLRRDRELDCRDVARIIHAYLDGELDDAPAAQVHRHLELCRDCGVEEETLLAVKAAVARRRRPTDERVRARLVTFARDLVEDADQS